MKVLSPPRCPGPCPVKVCLAVGASTHPCVHVFVYVCAARASSVHVAHVCALCVCVCMLGLGPTCICSLRLPSHPGQGCCPDPTDMETANFPDLSKVIYSCTKYFLGAKVSAGTPLNSEEQPGGVPRIGPIPVPSASAQV